MSTWRVLCRIYLDSGTRNWSDNVVLHPSRVYDGVVKNWGLIDMSIPCPSGLPQNGDGKIRVIDTNFELRDIMAVETLRGKFIDLKIVEEGASESAVVPFRFVIKSAVRGPGYTEIAFQSRSFWWLDEEIPNLITKENYPDLQGDENQFLNIVNGHNVSPLENPQGVIPCPYIGWILGTGDRFAAGGHEFWDIIQVYKLEPGSSKYVPVDPGDYNITVEVRTFIEYGALPFTVTYIDFLAELPKGTKISMDADGIFQSYVWNGIPGSFVFEDHRNPIRFFINMIFTIFWKAGEDNSVWDAADLEALMNRFYSMIPDSTSSTGFSPVLCDGALTRSMTTRSFLGQFLPSFDMDMFQKLNGKFTLNFTEDSDSSRPEFTQETHILEESFTEELANPTANQARYKSKVNYVTGNFASQKIYDNPIDQLAVGVTQFDSTGEPLFDSTGALDKTPQIETDTVEFLWARDDLTTDFMIVHRMGYLALGSFRQDFEMKFPEVFQNVELAKLIGITHDNGTQIGGYFNKEVKILGMTINLDKMVLTVRSILREPQNPVVPEVHDVEAMPFSGPFTLEGDPIEPEGIDVDVTHELISRPQQSSDTGSTSYNSTLVPFDKSWFDGVDGYELEGFLNNTDSVARLVKVYDVGTGNVVQQISIDPGTVLHDTITVAIPAGNIPDGLRSFYMQIEQTTADFQVQVLALRIRIKQRGAFQSCLQFPLMYGGAINQFDLVSGRNRFVIAGDTGYLEENGTIFYKDPNGWKQPNGWMLSSVAGNTNILGSASYSLQLRNRLSGGAVVTNIHTVGGSNTQLVLSDFSHDQLNFTQGSEFVLFSRETATHASNSLLLRVDLYVKVTNISKMVVPKIINSKQAVNSLLGLGDISDIFHEAVGVETSPGTVNFKLVYGDNGTEGEGTTVVTGSTIDPVGASLKRYRQSITLPSGTKYYDWTSGSGSGAANLDFFRILIAMER